MKFFRYCILLTLVIISILLQSCGGGGSNTDTSGALTVTGATTDNKDGSYSVNFTTIYAPPAGKSIQGVVVNYKWIENGLLRGTGSWTYSSLDTSHIIFGGVAQSTSSSVDVIFTANIGDMSSSASVIVPALPTVTGPAINFTATAISGDQKTSAITGGVAPYTIDGSTTDLGISLAGNTVTVTLLRAPPVGGTIQNHTITITDAHGNQGAITVSYF